METGEIIYKIVVPVLVGIILLIAALYFLRKYIKGGVCKSKARMDGKTVIVTGSNTGIGKETVRDMCRRGAKVVMACRNVEMANKAAQEIRDETKGDITVYKLDLADFSSIRECANKINEAESRIDVLINNAGVWFKEKKLSKDGYEMNIGTNHYGLFLFTMLLVDKIKATGPGSRIVNVSSIVHEYLRSFTLDDINWEKRNYDGDISYYESKLAVVLFTKELARRLKGTGVTTYSLHPGVVNTDLFKNFKDRFGVTQRVLGAFFAVFAKNVVDGAQTNIYCAVEESIAKDSGKYYADCKEKRPNPIANDEDLAKKLWDLSLETVGLPSDLMYA